MNELMMPRQRLDDLCPEMFRRCMQPIGSRLRPSDNEERCHELVDTGSCKASRRMA